jgi:hypothetical protein
MFSAGELLQRYKHSMYDYVSQITDFIKQNFAPAENAQEANTRMSSEELLSFLFVTFPYGCISDYELNEIMLKLHYKRETYTIANVVSRSKKEIENDVPVTYTYELCTGWCMNSVAIKNKVLTN